jgi:hypothetical protein
MKRIIITEEEKNSIIRMYYKGKLNETKGAQNMSPNCVGASVECFGGTNGDWDGTMPLVKKIANYTNLTHGSQKRWKKLSASGNISNHWCGLPFQYAIDLPCSGKIGDENFQKIKDELVKDGYLTDEEANSGDWKNNVNTYPTFVKDGFRCQVLWKSDSGHYDHIHVGCKKISPTNNVQSDNCDYSDLNNVMKKITIDELKNAWENKLTPKVKFLFEDKPELLKSKSFDGTVNRDYHTRWTFAEHRFIGDGTNGVTLSLIGERQDNEEELSNYYYEISKGTEFSNSERKVLPMDDSSTTIIDSQTNEAVLKFKLYGSEFENWPASRETGNFDDQAYNAIGL